MNVDQIEVKQIEESDVVKIRNIEKFFSPQGEGEYVGMPTVWLRTWGCTNRCRGFGASDPTDPSTYDSFTEEYDPKALGVSSVTDLPVFKTGCDSRHTWDKRYRHLSKLETVSDIADQLTDLMRNEYNPDGLFANPRTQSHNHLAITGGEPMMHQAGIIELVKEFIRRDNVPMYITIETNCTVPLTSEFKNFAIDLEEDYGIELLFSMSPKLQTVSGDDPKIAHKPNVVAEYIEYAMKAYLKVVVVDRDDVWQELESRIRDYWVACDHRNFQMMSQVSDIWVMPVGSDSEGQSISAGDVANKASAMGYRICPRAHIQWFGNEHCT